jgi:hypothetical protein
MLSRRELIGKAAVGAVATLAVGAAGAGIASTRDMHTAPGDLLVPSGDRGGQDAPAPPADAADSAAISSPPPWELVSPLAAGSVVAHGWRLADLGPVRDGSCVVTLQNDRGRSRRVHLCRNDGNPQGIVYTRRVDLVVMNEGHGDLPTEEKLAQAVAELAHTVAANEAKAPNSLVADLLPHAERLRRFASVDGPYADGKLR